MAKASKSASKSSSKSGAKKSATKKAGTGRAANPAFMAPLKPSAKLAEVVGDKPLPRTEVVKKIWDYIKKKDLQDSKNRRMINADEKLRPLFGKDQISMFDLARIVNNHLEK